MILRSNRFSFRSLLSLHRFYSSYQLHDVYIYNSTSKAMEKFEAKYPGTIFWYSCGPTVYDSSHIGHASTYVTFDIIHRILKHVFNYNIVLMMGITDIDDKIIQRSQKEKVHYLEISKKYEQEFIDDMQKLNVQSPTLYARVSDHIPLIINFIQRLIDKGVAYACPSGSVYFDMNQYGEKHDYQHHRMNEQGLSSIEADILAEKRSTRDFALWKGRDPASNELKFQSPWGYGRPGWHIECSAMASRTFGSHLDIHSGGLDLVFPHHANEILQSTAYHGNKTWVKYWLHSGLLNTKSMDEKMSKSLNNTILIRDMLETYTPAQFRLFCLMHDYRSPRSFESAAIQQALFVDKLFRSFFDTVQACQKGLVDVSTLSEAETISRISNTQDEIIDVLANNFDTPSAMTRLQELVHWINSHMNYDIRDNENAMMNTSTCALHLAVDFIQSWLEIFGIDMSISGGQNQKTSSDRILLENVIEKSVQFRTNIRGISRQKVASGESPKKQLLEQCDDYRLQMKYLGVEIKDRHQGSTWSLKK
ncbi:unnamed protein product [Adineta ricciae]|uniref:cysteine--tRNA ligase n=1 Tax=Adineta ricciae TaxID=249248 RepID=A0A813MV41_ADIRI|nr:unnamed protein product [Adineta ricciae]CAF0866674.1 unnamed protein product [Adineta ricciae]